MSSRENEEREMRPAKDLEKNAPRPAAVSAGKRILIVDDDEMNRKVLGGFIERLGHEPVFADSGPEAFGKLDESVDLMLLDVLMPGMNGFDLAKRIRCESDFKDVPIIMVTTLSNTEDRQTAIRAGANDFLSKPVDRNELEARLNSLLGMREARKDSERYQTELEDSVKALKKARDELELRVRERTRELREVNEELRRELAEKRCAKTELQLLEEIFRNSLQGIVITDVEGTIQRVNPA